MHDNTAPSPAITYSSFAEGIAEIGTTMGKDSESRRAAAFADRMRQAVLAIKDGVESKPQVLGGAAVLRGTRFSDGQLFAELAEGDNIDAIALDFELDREAQRGLLHALAVSLSEPAAS